jgi:hypothetical protein
MRAIQVKPAQRPQIAMDQTVDNESNVTWVARIPPLPMASAGLVQVRRSCGAAKTDCGR